ncbi:39138_t:CDS:1, partial [Gigaspora margarita]
VSQLIDNPNKITNQNAEFIFKLAKKLALPKEYILLKKMINQVELENYLLLDINTVLFEAIENSKLNHNDKQQLQDLRIKRFMYFSYQRAISYIPSVENGFALHRRILADKFLDDILRTKLMVQFEEIIIPICL